MEKSCPRCSQQLNPDAVICPHCGYRLIELPPSTLPQESTDSDQDRSTTDSPDSEPVRSRRSFWPELRPDTPVVEILASPFVMILSGCWIFALCVLLAIVADIIPAAPKVEFPGGGKKWDSKEEEKAANRAWSKRKAFEDVQDFSIRVLVAPFGILFCLYIIMTENPHQSDPDVIKGTSGQVRFVYGLLAIIGLFMVLGGPFLITYSLWKYLTMP